MTESPPTGLAPEINPAIRGMMRAARDMLQHEHSLLGSLGFKPLLLGAGKTSFSLDLPARFGDGSGMIHGGFLTVVLDSLFGLTVFTAMEEFKPIATINLRTDYIKEVPAGSRVNCDSVCEGVRNEVAYVSGRLTLDADKSLIAIASGAFMVGTKGPAKGSRL